VSRGARRVFLKGELGAHPCVLKAYYTAGEKRIRTIQKRKTRGTLNHEERGQEGGEHCLKRGGRISFADKVAGEGRSKGSMTKSISV